MTSRFDNDMRDQIADIIFHRGQPDMINGLDDTGVLHLVHTDGYCEGCKDTPCVNEVGNTDDK